MPSYDISFRREGVSALAVAAVPFIAVHGTESPVVDLGGAADYENALAAHLPNLHMLLFKRDIRAELVTFGELDDSDVESEVLSCYLPHGSLHFYLGGGEGSWRWWKIDRREKPPRLPEDFPLSKEVIPEIHREARSLSV